MVNKKARGSPGLLNIVGKVIFILQTSAIPGHELSTSRSGEVATLLRYELLM